jgi:serine O-acetyltransferase
MEPLKNHTPWQALQADTHRQYGAWRLSHLTKGALTRRTFRVLVTLRVCQHFASVGMWAKPALLIAKLLHRICTRRAGMDLSWNTDIGAGAALTHGWGLVVSPGAVIGTNCTLFHGVTLGKRIRLRKDGTETSGFPILEDQVWVGPHAVIVGDVRIGQGSRIGAGAFVTEDIPPFSVVQGNPAMIVRSGCVPDVSNPAPLC